MGVCASNANVSPSGKPPKKLLKKNEIFLIDEYLPNFCYHNASTEDHRIVAARHWNTVFKDEGVASNRSARVTSTASTHERSNATSSAPPPAKASRIGVLYDTFYEYLEKHSPQLKPVFRSSMQVRGKVLVHISAGMRTILSNDSPAEKVAALTKTHLRFGVKLEYFNPLGNALLYAMCVVSGDEWSPEIEDAWRRLFAHCSALLLVHHEKQLRLNAKQKNKKGTGPEAHSLFPSHK